jgi:hypothetical protein
MVLLYACATTVRRIVAEYQYESKQYRYFFQTESSRNLSIKRATRTPPNLVGPRVGSFSVDLHLKQPETIDDFRQCRIIREF